jgi:hypothetical protein
MCLKLIPVILLLSGCASAPLMLTGAGVASVAVNETTGKSITDHTLSTVNGKDCRALRYFKDQPVCQEPNQTASVDATVNTKKTGTQTMESIWAERREKNRGK